MTDDHLTDKNDVKSELPVSADETNIIGNKPALPASQKSSPQENRNTPEMASVLQKYYENRGLLAEVGCGTLPMLIGFIVFCSIPLLTGNKNSLMIGGLVLAAVTVFCLFIWRQYSLKRRIKNLFAEEQGKETSPDFTLNHAIEHLRNEGYLINENPGSVQKAENAWVWRPWAWAIFVFTGLCYPLCFVAGAFIQNSDFGLKTLHINFHGKTVQIETPPKIQNRGLADKLKISFKFKKYERRSVTWNETGLSFPMSSVPQVFGALVITLFATLIIFWLSRYPQYAFECFPAKGHRWKYALIALIAFWSTGILFVVGALHGIE